MRIALWGNTPLMKTSRISEIVTRISQYQVVSLVDAIVKRAFNPPLTASGLPPNYGNHTSGPLLSKSAKTHLDMKSRTRIHGAHAPGESPSLLQCADDGVSVVLLPRGQGPPLT